MAFNLLLTFSSGSQASYILPLVKYLQRKVNTKQTRSFIFFMVPQLQKEQGKANKQKTYKKSLSEKKIVLYMN